MLNGKNTSQTIVEQRFSIPMTNKHRKECKQNTRKQILNYLRKVSQATQWCLLTRSLSYDNFKPKVISNMAYNKGGVITHLSHEKTLKICSKHLKLVPMHPMPRGP